MDTQKSIILSCEVVITVARYVLDNKSRKVLNKALNVVINSYGKGVKDNELVYSPATSLAKLVGDKNDKSLGMAFMELLMSSGFISMFVYVSREGAREFVFNVKVDTQELRQIARLTNARSTKLFKIEPVKGNLCIRSKYDYQQDIEPVSDVIDYLNGVAIKFKDNIDEDNIVEIAKQAVKDEDDSMLFDEAWKQAIKQDYLDEFEIVKSSGNRFYIPRQTDGIGRMYEQSKFGFHQGHLHKELLELADQEVLNEDGRWAMRQYIVELAGYRPNGNKPTEEEAEEYFIVNYNSLVADNKTSEAMAIYESNEPTGLLVEVDAQTQGPSLYGLLVGDEKLSYNTAIIGNTCRTDMYGMLAAAMNSRLSTNVWTRSNCKSALMTKGYGAKYKTIMFGSGKDSDYDS